jgi:hypothetical protein
MLLLAFPAQAEQQTLEQDTLAIRGNRALPKTLYIGPWKRLGSPLEGGEWRSLLDDELDPVERDIFRRELELRRQGFSLD